MSIVIVEDSKPMRNLVKRALRKAGFGDQTISEAGDGQEGLQLIRDVNPDLVLADWNMPHMNGLELLEALRAEENEVQFGFVTSEQSMDMRNKAAEAGALFLIGKPFSAEEFRKHLGTIFPEQATPTGGGIPLRYWLDAVVTAIKAVAVNPLGYASGAEVVSYPEELDTCLEGCYMPFDGAGDLLWLCLVSDTGGCQSLSRALFALGPDDQDLPPDEVLDAIGEIMNIASGLVKSQIREHKGTDIELSLGLPKMLETSSEIEHRKDKSIAEIRIGPVAARLVVVKAQ